MVASEASPAAGIRTPDQHLRVFVSSTLGELADERAAVRQAVDGLRLAPIMFELGARPHPPRQLYRAYLEQSHIFVGIYWQKYGWVAPGMSVSGLEDELLLSGDKPRLLYIKAPAPEREERLTDLLSRLREDGSASYKSFSNAAELRDLVQNDLALLLTERFESALLPAATVQRARLPAPPTRLVGREREIAQIESLLQDGGARLVTLVGPGGIGKSRVALAAAERLAGAYPDGVYFVPLAPIREPQFVPSAIVRALDLNVQPGATPLESVQGFLAGKRTLLVLDNFEQILDAAPLVAQLLQAAPHLAVLVTSRAVLKLSSEQEFPVPPLPLPVGTAQATVSDNDAVRLFVQRARAVAPDFRLTDDNAATVAAICVALEGLPLAIELAAARIKFIPVGALLRRLDKRLELLTGGSTDLPDRQRTLRATLDWSFDLLSAAEQHLFARLSMFVGGCRLAAAEAIGQDLQLDVAQVLFSLADKSLLRHQLQDDESRFWQLEVVRDYARAKLEQLGEQAEVARAHRDYFVAFTQAAQAGLLGHDQPYWLEQVAHEQANVRAVLRRALAHNELSSVVTVGWNLWRYWWIRNQHAEGRSWMEGALAHAAELSPQQRMHAYFVAGAMAIAQADVVQAGAWVRACLELARSLGDRQTEGVGLLGAGLVSLFGQDLAAAEAELTGALTLFRQEGDWWGQAHALHYLWRYQAVLGHAVQAMGNLQESVRLFEANGDLSGKVLILHDLAVTTLVAGDVTEALRLLDQGFTHALQLKNRWFLAYCFEGLGCVMVELGDLRAGARYFGLADRLRNEVQTARSPFDQFQYAPFLTRLEAELEPSVLEQELAAGRGLHVLEALQAKPVALAAR